MSISNHLDALHERLAAAGLESVPVDGNELTLFEHSTPLIASMVDDIRTATSRVWLESYIFADDAAGRAVATALIERAQAGVDVRVIYDALGSLTTRTGFFMSMIDAGVQVHAFHPFWNVVWNALWRSSVFRLLNQRDHRKMLIVDDRVAYFGGMNVIDQSGLDSVQVVKNQRLPASAGWRDVQVRLDGPQQAVVADAFHRLWKRKHERRRVASPRWPIEQMLRSTRDEIFFFDSQPMLKLLRPARIFVPLIRNARHSILLSMAYFIPIGAVLRELYRARQRGVVVRVIIPAESDVPAVQWATRHFYTELLARGIRIFERQDRMLHGKVMVIDGEWTLVGSCNLDPRSLWRNLEYLAVVHSASFASAVRRICRDDMQASRRVTYDTITRRSWWTRLLDRFAWYFRTWL